MKVGWTIGVFGSRKEPTQRMTSKLRLKSRDFHGEPNHGWL